MVAAKGEADLMRAVTRLAFDPLRTQCSRSTLGFNLFDTGGTVALVRNWRHFAGKLDIDRLGGLDCIIDFDPEIFVGAIETSMSTK